jgi:glutamine synthetase
MTVLNAAVAQQLRIFKKALDVELEAGKTLEVAVMDTLKPIIRSVLDVICFDGNGYSDEWKKEAARRGLDTETRVPEMIKAFCSPSSVELFTSENVYTLKELEARNEVKWDIYSKKIQIEARVLGRMATNHIIPAALTYQNVLLKNIAMMKEVYPDSYQQKAAVALSATEQISRWVSEVQQLADKLLEACRKADAIEDEYTKAQAYYEIAESLSALRDPIDKLEEIVDNDIWPLPKYRELLFIS